MPSRTKFNRAIAVRPSYLHADLGRFFDFVALRTQFRLASPKNRAWPGAESTSRLVDKQRECGVAPLR